MIPVVFMGTPEFACPSLEALIQSDAVDVKGVVTQPNRPKGRGMRFKPPPVKVLAQQHGIPILQPVKLDEPEVLPWLKEADPKALVVVAYAAKIPDEILYLAPHGCLNLHPSLLPRYRGAAGYLGAGRNNELS